MRIAWKVAVTTGFVFIPGSSVRGFYCGSWPDTCNCYIKVVYVSVE